MNRQFFVQKESILALGRHQCSHVPLASLGSLSKNQVFYIVGLKHKICWRTLARREWQRNSKLLLKHSQGICPYCARKGDLSRRSVDRPSNRLGIQASITFLYYKDLAAAQEFYEDVLGLRLIVDQGFSKIYQVSPTSFVGLVDEKQGMHLSSESKAVTLSFVTEEIDEWYDYLLSKGVKMRRSIANSSLHPTRGFVAYDPEGYYLEFEKFLDDQQNAAALKTLRRES